MKLSGLDLLLWVAGLFGNAVLLTALLVTQRAKQFPAFTGLICLAVIRTTLLMLISRHYGFQRAYFYTYWSCGALDVSVQLLVFVEAVRQVFYPNGSFARDTQKSLAAIGCASIFVAAMLTWLAAPPMESFIGTCVAKTDFFFTVVMSELFVGLVVLSSTSGLPLRTHVARIVEGLGLYCLLGLLVQIGQNLYGFTTGNKTFAIASQLQAWLYLGCLVYWTVTLAQRAPKPRDMPETLHAQLVALQRGMSRALQRAHGRESA